MITERAVTENGLFKHIDIDVDGEIYKWTVPVGTNDNQIEIDFRKQLYPNAFVLVEEATEDTPKKTRPCQTLEEINQWIADNPDIEPIPWVSTHPEFPTASGEERATMVTDAKELIVNLTYADIDAHIDNVFGNLNVAQRASLKKLYKATLFLLKK